jgi:hypothetical protein
MLRFSIEPPVLNPPKEWWAVLPDAVRIYRRGSISEGLHPTLMVAGLEAAKVGNPRQMCSYGDRTGIRRFAT